MTDYLQITTTTGNRQDAEQIAADLISRRLAGCVQVGGPVSSTFRWQGRVETAEEWICIIKTSVAQVAAIQAALAQIHPYEVPEVIATPIVAGNAAYLRWLSEQLGAETASDNSKNDA